MTEYMYLEMYCVFGEVEMLRVFRKSSLITEKFFREVEMCMYSGNVHRSICYQVR
jgi:hypothetical protein